MPLKVDQGNEHLRDALARAIAATVEFPPGVFVTVMSASISPSQRDANAILSVFPANREQDALDALETYRHDMKDELGKSLRLRQIPRFTWKFDATGAYIAGIDETIEELKKKGDL